MDAEITLLRAIDRDIDVPLFRRSLELRLLPSAGPRSLIADRARFLRAATVLCLRARFGAATPLASGTVAYDPRARDPRFVEYRSDFIERHYGVGTDFVGRGERRAAKARGPWLSWYLRGLAVALLALTDLSQRRYAWLGGVLVDVQCFLRVLPELDRVFVFGLYDRRPYVLATFLARHTGVPVTLVYQNIPLYRNCRYLHLEVPVVVTSKVNLAEAEHYRASGTFRATELTYHGPEYALDLEGLEPAEPTWDIGYFSSGEWARWKGLYQSSDIEAIRRGAFAGNLYSVRSQGLLRSLAAYARERGRSLRVYLHPFERTLLAEHGVAPPYADVADGGLVSFDDEPGNSRRKVYECAVAVSLQSSYIWERLDLGLEDSFMYESEDREENSFSRESLGPYAEKLFRDEREMIEKVDEALTRRGAGRGPLGQ